jgi:hypothetical protein
MAITVTWRGVAYTIPEPGDAFTQDLTSFLNALSSGAVPFPSTADIDLGAAFGLKSLYLKSRSANPAASGLVRNAVADLIAWRNNANSADLQLGVNAQDQLIFAGVPISRKLVALVYSAAMTIDASQGDTFVVTATNGAAFTFNAPTNPVTGMRITLRLRNASGGALGAATFNGVFKMPAWTNPANGFSRSEIFEYDGFNWIAVRPDADVPN